MENLFIRVARDKTFENAKWIDFLDNSIDPLIENINNAKFSGSVKKNIEEFDKYKYICHENRTK